MKTSVPCLFVLLLLAGNCLADDWSQWRGQNRAGVWTESGIISSFTADDVKPAWRQPIGTGYSSPTVAGGKLFVMGYSESESSESIKCFDAGVGAPVWERKYKVDYRGVGYAAGPRAAVTIDKNRAYAMGAMGQLHCLDVETGETIWEKDLNSEYVIANDKRVPIWGMACSPLVFENQLIIQIGAKDAGVIALDTKTGSENWRALDDRGQYSSPVLVKQNNKDVVVCWTGDSVAGIDPNKGEVYWRYTLKPSRMPIGVATPIVNGNRIFVTSFYDGAAMLEMSQSDMSVKEVWRAVGENERSTKAIHSIISTPVWIGGYIYGMDSYGELRCLKAETGERVWEDTSLVNKARWGTIHFVPNGDSIWMFNEQGELMVGKLDETGATVTSRVKVLEPNQMRQRNRRGAGVCWSHPAFADKCVFLRNDSEVICINLEKK